MADVTNDKEKFGCSAWLESIRGTMNEQWTRARNTIQKKVHRGNKTVQPLNSVSQIADAGSGDPVVARKRVLCPRPAIVDVREDINYLRAMISSLNSADLVKGDTFVDKFDFGRKKDDFLKMEIDVDTLVDEILCKVRKELEEELRKIRVTLASSVYTVTGSSSVTSSQLSDFELDIDLEFECKKLQNEFDSGMYCNELIEVAE